ncbi:sarcosine oxidase subunit gamma [Lutibaculum baratangense]|uniref:Sarcosine oxidase gamma subunit n=1 Tax=Lutibaculum baratangense AMV1 TaxID=631454 RepID=V4R9F4_9HYPH|nr:sarcosine oxidase subunit gamma family protein [Lutibaculum baratangense]ESR22831.1 Sarcosine oxidase gamma subunit [Lutibaculum baratangense AMV1]
MSDARRRSPLHGRSEISSGEAATVREHAFLGKLVLRGAPGDIAPALRELTGTAGPEDACRSASSNGRSVLWIGPDEHWLVVPAETEIELARDLDSRLAGVRHHVVDVTDYHVAIGLSGTKAWEVLAKLTPFDVHPKAFAVGAVAGTVIGRGQGVLWRPAEGSALDSDYIVFIRSSMADYLWCLLAEAGRQFGMTPETPIGGETWRLAR